MITPGGPSSSTPTWVKWALGAAGLIILALIFAVITSRGSDTITPPQKPAAQPQPQAKPTTWQQNYSTTFRYGQNSLTVVEAKVKNLNKKQAKVSYRMLARNLRGDVSWVRQKNRWLLRSPGRRTNPSSITVSRYGSQYRLALSFSWPRSLLYQGSALQISIPGAEGNEQALLGIEIPKDNRGVQERRGVASLTR